MLASDIVTVLAFTSFVVADTYTQAQADALFIPDAIVDAKGDIIAATASDTVARLAVGANNNFLTADSTATTGLKWSGAYTSFTPVYAGVTIGNGTNVGQYLRIGNFVHVTQKFTLGSTSSVTNNIRPTLPLNATNSDNTIMGTMYLEDSGVTVYLGIVIKTSTTQALLQLENASGTYLSTTSTNAGVPFTYGTNDNWTLSYIYEVA
jgi:hypothetical protein